MRHSANGVALKEPVTGWMVVTELDELGYWPPHRLNHFDGAGC